LCSHAELGDECRHPGWLVELGELLDDDVGDRRLAEELVGDVTVVAAASTARL
jgi:hypothetical protein